MRQLISLPLTPKQGDSMPKVAEWEKVAKNQLQGRTIVNLFYLNKQETEEMGWDRSGIVLVLDNGAQVITQQDDEGNGPGAMVVMTNETSVTLPVLWT